MDSIETDGEDFFCSEEPLSESDEELFRRSKHAFHYEGSDEDEGYEFEDEQDYASVLEREEGEEPVTFSDAFDSCL